MRASPSRGRRLENRTGRPRYAPPRARRALFAVLAFLGLAAGARGEAPHRSYENCLDALARLGSAGAAPTVLIYTEALVLGEKVPGGLAASLEAEKGRALATAISSDLPATAPARIVTLASRPFPTSSLAADSGGPGATKDLLADDAALVAAAPEGRSVLVLRIIAYHSGLYDTIEIRAQLFDRQSGRRLALDVEWSTLVDGKVDSDFVNGLRID